MPKGLDTAPDDQITRLAQNGYWPGSYSTNPNRQIGKLYFDINPGTGVTWSHCSGTAVNSENKSIVITAGHCAYNPDPDNNGLVSGNGRWYQNFQFCPGYENNCKLGIWTAKRVTTTNSWFYGVNGRYSWIDDVAAVQVNLNANSRRLVNVVGGHGISFNASTGAFRSAFGYPLTDSRWPEYTYSGQDLVYCQGRDTYYTSVMRIPCTMTGGSSGGPWLRDVNSSWLGILNSVNSHKAWGGPYMGGPYFGAAESRLFQQVRNQP
jgi:hypothetical protein